MDDKVPPAIAIHIAQVDRMVATGFIVMNMLQTEGGKL
jgi:hypothetical protein